MGSAAQCGQGDGGVAIRGGGGAHDTATPKGLFKVEEADSGKSEVGLGGVATAGGGDVGCSVEPGHTDRRAS